MERRIVCEPFSSIFMSVSIFIIKISMRYGEGYMVLLWRPFCLIMSTHSNGDASNAVNNGSSHVTNADNSDSPINNDSCGAPNRDNNPGEEFHVKCLHQMCRICAKVITGNTRYYSVNKYAKDLVGAYGVNFNVDKSDLHPPRFCFTCYGGVLNFRKRSTAPTRNVVNWEPHSHECSTCEKRGVYAF